MTEHQLLTTDTPWFRLDVTSADWEKEEHRDLARMLEQLLVIRYFEEKILNLFKAGLVHGPAHSSIGQEAGAIGAMSVLSSKDKINGTHRAHHQFLAKFLNYATPETYDPRSDPFPNHMQEMIYRSMAEIMGLKPGFCGGRGGSMHMRLDEAGVLGTNAIVGGNPPQATGYALAEKLRESDNITITFFGDGAAQNGASYEALNLGALYDLPIIYFIENNLYGVSTHVSETTRESRLSARGLGLAIPAIEVDGMNILAVRRAVQWAAEHIREENGPVLIEANVYRYFHQHGPLRGSAFGYRSKEEEELWMTRDPLATFPAKLIELGVIEEESLRRLDSRAKDSIEAAEGGLIENDPETKKSRIIPDLWPNPQTAQEGIRGDLSELSNLDYFEADELLPSSSREVKYIDSIAIAQLHAMEQDETIIILGEDVHRLGGGTVGATKGIAECFSNRLIGTPITENGFCGLALGAAINGLKPIIEIMYADFCLVAADQLFNQIAKVRHMFGGDDPVPLVLRVRVAAGGGYGSQHSMDVSGLFSLWPGWRIIAPTTPFDYIGLFNSAIQCNDPVLIIEPQSLYQVVGSIPDNLDYAIPFGKAKVIRSGADCTILSCANMIPISLEATLKTDTDAEIIDLRTLDPLGLDWRTISTSIKRTNRVMIVEQTARGPTIGARIIQEIQQNLFDDLDHEVVHVTGSDAAPVVSKVLENAALAGVEDVITGLREVMD